MVRSVRPGIAMPIQANVDPGGMFATLSLVFEKNRRAEKVIDLGTLRLNRVEAHSQAAALRGILPPRMRVRIIRVMTGEVDGIPLSRFKVGHTYDMPASLATYLMVSGWATAVAELGPAMVIPLDDVESL